jgi:FkbM family methyltransferase
MTFDRRSYFQIDLNIKDVLLNTFKESDSLIIFDIGACEGEDSIKYSNLFENAIVFTFEPRDDNFKLVIENISQFKKDNKIKPYKLALSNEDGEATFYISSGRPEDRPSDLDWDFGNKSSSLLPPSSEIKKATPWLEFKEEISVKTQRLDNFMNLNGLNQIDFIHLDVQGAELLVLEGCGEKMKNIKAVWMEVEVVELYKGQPLKNDIEQFMNKNDFVCIKSDIDHVSGDQLYLNRQHFSEKQIRSISMIERKSLSKRFKLFIKRLLKW